jgi:hypothetical protein
VSTPYWRRIETASPINDFALNRLARRCLCNTLGRTLRDWAAYCCEISAASARAAAIVDFARSSLASALRTFLGAAKSCATVIFFKIPPPRRWMAARPY